MLGGAKSLYFLLVSVSQKNQDTDDRHIEPPRCKYKFKHQMLILLAHHFVTFHRILCSQKLLNTCRCTSEYPSAYFCVFDKQIITIQHHKAACKEYFVNHYR